MGLRVGGVALAVRLLWGAHGYAAVDASSPPAALDSLPRDVRADPAADPVAELDACLLRLTGADAAARQDALTGLDETEPALFSAIARRLALLKGSTDRSVMASVLAGVRPPSKPAGASADDRAAAGEARAVDVLERVMAAARPADADWRNVASILFLSRMLVRIGTTPATREIMGIYETWGEPVRVDVERQIKQLDERAVPALIELRRAESRDVRALSLKLLDTLGKAVPGEAVQTASKELLAEVLRAYGRSKDADAARVIVAFVNSDRALVRDAARESVAMLGELALPQLRESYEGLLRKKPPPDWPWDKVALELFVACDRTRLAEVYALMDDGLSAQKAGQMDAMMNAFDRVLAREPMFERRAEMVPGLVDFARSIEGSEQARARAILRRALRLEPDGPRARQVEAELLYLDAAEWSRRGVVDEAGYRRVLALDPSNEGAKRALDSLKAVSESRVHAGLRYGAFLLGGAILIAAGAFFALRRAAR